MENQMAVVVHKASLPLMDGESLHDFNYKFSDAARKHLRQKLNLGTKDDVWGVETFGDSAVFCVYYDQSVTKVTPSMRYYMVNFTRDGDGKFSFSSTTEVQRVTTFQPVTDVTKAVWTAAQVNDLPDSAFLFISPGGKKDAGGKTTPRSLRHFPVRGPDGKLDGPHLRNALARIPQAKIPAPAKAAATKEAQRLLAEFNKQTTTKAADTDAAAIEATHKSMWQPPSLWSGML
jgi:hypothetical protein